MTDSALNTQLKEYSKTIEDVFILLSTKFPRLLARDGSTSLEQINGLLTGISDSNVSAGKKEEDFFNGYSLKYKPVFDHLNSKLEELDKLNKHIADIKDDSEEMELIALNAMVISIKSGEKGRAFSCITENLKRLSTDMILYSNNLIGEEKNLQTGIQTVNKTFMDTLNSQKNMMGSGQAGYQEVVRFINDFSGPLQQIKAEADAVYPPIQKAMEGIQMQDIIRQALDHVTLCLSNLDDDSHSVEDESRLDAICYNMSLLELADNVLSDVNSDIASSSSIFTKNWSTVSEILNHIEEKRSSYISRFLSESGNTSENILHRLDQLTQNFKDTLSHFAHYQVVQKGIVRDCQIINEQVRTMYAVFENLGPVVNRLHHVRILQQIEVSKNTAISSVRDAVTDMDNLIIQANNSLDTMNKLIETFTREIDGELTTFVESIDEDTQLMQEIRLSKNAFFDSLKDAQAKLNSQMKNFTVFPEGFTQDCVDVTEALESLRQISSQFETIRHQFELEESSLAAQKTQLLEKLNLKKWEIKDPRFQELIRHFTITAHKEKAGQIGGFTIEKGKDAGEITFF